MIEEFSQMSAYLWNEIAVCLQKGVQFILLGDPGQLRPIKDMISGNEVKADLVSSDLFHELAGGFKMTLTENKRSDQKLFDFYTGLKAGLTSERPLAEALVDARRIFPVKPGLADYYLCISHRTRMAVNHELNKQLKSDDAVLYEAGPPKRGENSPQDMWLYAGLQLVGAGGQVKKGSFHTVIAVDDQKTVRK